MLYKVCVPLTIRTLSRQTAKDVQRLFSKDSERGSTKAVLLSGTDENDYKWKKLNNERRQLYMPNQRHFHENHSISSIRKQLMDTFPSIVQDFVDDPKYKDTPEAVNCFKDTLERTVMPTKNNTAVCLVHCYISMEDPKNITPESITRVNILAWCYLMAIASMVIIDDLADGAEYRLGSKCWYKNEDVGLRAITDCALLDFYTYQLLKTHFSHLPMYVPILQTFRREFMKVAIGFYIDTIPLNANKGLEITRCTRKRFQTVSTYKTSPLGFELPYQLARCLTNKFQTEIPSRTREVLMNLGEFMQIQNDFRDCYDDVFKSKKTANDIEEGKATWLITVALEKANPEQRRLLEAHYGRKNAESVNIVKDLYKILEIPKAYANYEKEAFDFIQKNIEEISKLTCLELMLKPLTKLYQPYI